MIRAWVYGWLKENEDLLKSRVEQGHICDGHGDLRCESVCITNGICIFDCIEFNKRFRCADVANEAAFLAMDLAAYGRPDLGYLFYESYARMAGEDEELFKLYSFYRCYRAFIRGKVLSFQLDEKELSEEQHRAARQKAKNYFTIAADSAGPLQMPVIIMVAGLSGTGKTSVARAIAGELGLRVVSSDAVRQTLFGANKKRSEYGKGKYDAESNRLTYQKMFERGIELLKKDGGVILDATFLQQADREKVGQMAKSHGALCRLIECRLPPEIVRERLSLRAEKKDGLSDADWQIYERQKIDLEPIEMGNDEHLVINTEDDLLSNCRQAADWLRTNCV
jgi:predicted kinase